MESAQDRIVHIITGLIPSDGEWKPGEVAGQAQTFLRENHADLLAEWHAERERAFIQDVVNRINGDQRRDARKRTLKDRVIRAAERVQEKTEAAVAEGAEPEAAQDQARAEVHSLMWNVSYMIDSKRTQKPVRLMNRQDLLFAAGKYHDKADFNRREALYLRLLAKKLPDDVQVVEDVLTPEQVDEAYVETHGNGCEPEEDVA